jgi:hypothetical protein
MRITVNPSFEWNGERYVLASFEDQYEYDGPVVMCGGDSGETEQERQARASQLATANTLNGIAQSNNAQQQEIFKTIKPFGTSRMSNGLPFFNALTDYAAGTNAQAAAPARARLLRSLGSQSGLPSGFREGALSDFENQRAHGFDQALTGNLFANEQAKQQGAQILSGQAGQLNPLGFYQATQQGYNPQQYRGPATPGMGGAILGAAGGALSAIPF